MTPTTTDRAAELPVGTTVQNVPARPVLARAAILTRVGNTERRVLELLARVGIPVLRLSLAVVYLGFGALKLVGLSPVGELVAAMLPFLPMPVAVAAMGAFEVVTGILLGLGLLVPWVAAAQVLHLVGTFAVFVVFPALTFSGGNPLALTLTGEFIAKNLVLIAGLLVVAAFSRTRPARP